MKFCSESSHLFIRQCPDFYYFVHIACSHAFLNSKHPINIPNIQGPALNTLSLEIYENLSLLETEFLWCQVNIHLNDSWCFHVIAIGLYALLASRSHLYVYTQCLLKDCIQWLRTNMRTSCLFERNEWLPLCHVCNSLAPSQKAFLLQTPSQIIGY